MSHHGLLEPSAVQAARSVLRGPRRSNAPGLPDWRVGGRGAWLWVAANDEVTLCWVADGRRFADATKVIDGDYNGVLVRDGYVVYNHYSQARHQTCLAHLVRRCRDMEADLPRKDRATPAAAKAILHDALAARDLPADERTAAVADLQGRLETLVGRPVGNDANRRLLKHLAGQAPHLFTFLATDNVPATNYHGEQ